MMRIAALAVALTASGLAANAQQTSGNFAKQTVVVPGTTSTGGAIRLVDNKGTIKYLQVKNGITILSNTTTDVTTTTFQLGGQLTDSTSIDFNGKPFTFQTVPLSTGAAAVSSGTTGYSLLVRDEITGGVKKLLATDLIQSGQEVFAATADQTAYALTGSPTLPSYSKVWVFRNGAKLVANVDYTISGSTVTLVPPASPTSLNDWKVYAGDAVEVQWVK